MSRGKEKTKKTKLSNSQYKKYESGVLLDDKIKRKLKKYFILTIAALAFAIGIQIFISIPGTFSSGLGAFALVITYIWKAVGNYFAIIYLIINIPGIIWSYFYNHKKFTYRTAYFLVIQSLVSIPFMVIPDLEELITENLWGFNNVEDLRSGIWPLILIPSLGGLFVGAATGFCWKAGGSTAGIDILTHYFSTKKKMSIGIITRILAYLILIISITLTFSIEHESLKMWFIKIVGTVLFIQINSIMIDRVYPKYSKVELQIYTKKKADIEAYFSSSRYNHSYNLIKISTGMEKEKYLFTTVVLLLEVKKLVNVIGQIDPETWIKTADVKRVHGKFDTSFTEGDI